MPRKNNDEDKRTYKYECEFCIYKDNTINQITFSNEKGRLEMMLCKSCYETNLETLLKSIGFQYFESKTILN